MGRIDLCDGKYTIINELESGGGFRALRYGEEWRNLAGDKLVLALFQELEEAKEDVDRLRSFNQTLLQREGQANGRLLARIRELEAENERYKSALRAIVNTYGSSAVEKFVYCVRIAMIALGWEGADDTRD